MCGLCIWQGRMCIVYCRRQADSGGSPNSPPQVSTPLQVLPNMSINSSSVWGALSCTRYFCQPRHRTSPSLLGGEAKRLLKTTTARFSAYPPPTFLFFFSSSYSGVKMRKPPLPQQQQKGTRRVMINQLRGHSWAKTTHSRKTEWNLWQFLSLDMATAGPVVLSK